MKVTWTSKVQYVGITAFELGAVFQVKIYDFQKLCTANLTLLLGFTTPSNISYRIIYPAEIKTHSFEGYKTFVFNLHLTLKSQGVSKYPKSRAQIFKLINFYFAQQRCFYFNLKLLFYIIQNNMAVPNMATEWVTTMYSEGFGFTSFPIYQPH